jgi:dolichol-phosphate mannosyltransferase
VKTVVIVPTYNERENLPGIVTRLRSAAPDATVLVVDDDSPDGTGALAERLAAADPFVRVLHRPAKEGLGAAYRDGFRWALVAGFELVIEMDADGSHQPEQLYRLTAAIEAGADVALGSRWIPRGGVENWPARRRLLSRAGSAYARLALGLRVRDVTGGYRAFTADALRRIRFVDAQSQGYCFQIDMLWRAVTAGLRVDEVPITFVERVHGSSKMTADIVLEAMLRVTAWGIGSLPSRLRGARAKAAVVVSERA